MNDFEDFMTDVISLVKNDGTRVDNIKARVSGNQIRTFDVSLPLEEKDIIERQLPNGRTESFLVLDAGYGGGHPPEIPASFNIKVRKTTAIQDESKPPTIHHNYHGVQSVQHGNHNVAHNNQDFGLDAKEFVELIVKMRDAVSTIPEQEQEDALLMVSVLEDQAKSQSVNPSRIKALATSTALYLANKGVDLSMALGGTVLGDAIIKAIQN